MAARLVTIIKNTLVWGGAMAPELLRADAAVTDSGLAAILSDAQ